MPNDIVYSAAESAKLRNAVAAIVSSTPVTDMHTHLYAPAFGELLLWGVDETLTYHYLIAEFFRASDMPYETFWAMSKQEQADAIWKTLFIEHSPLSEACRGVLTVLKKLGLDTRTRDLASYRAWYARQYSEEFVERVFTTANIKCAVMTNDPFDMVERRVWEAGFIADNRFPAALRIDPLLNDWANAHEKLASWGYRVSATLDVATLAEVRRFLEDWVRRMDAKYMAVSLPPDFQMSRESPRAALIESCVIPVAHAFNIPFAMMIGVTRQVNPLLKLAGDGVDRSDESAVAYLCAKYPKNKFMVTMLSRENQHTLCVLARKFRNLMLFGCWWFLNNPSFIEEITRMRFEMLGASVVPQHSDARILDQVIYKWEHSREIIAKVLADKYEDLLRAGWVVSESEIRRDAEALLGGNFWRFIEMTL